MILWEEVGAQPYQGESITALIVIVVLLLLLIFSPNIIQFVQKFSYKRKLRKMHQADLWTYICSIGDPVSLAHCIFYYNRIDGRIYYRGVVYDPKLIKGYGYSLQPLDVPADEFIDICRDQGIYLSKNVCELFNLKYSSNNKIESEDDD